jgi:hypothetical protein
MAVDEEEEDFVEVWRGSSSTVRLALVVDVPTSSSSVVIFGLSSAVDEDLELLSSTELVDFELSSVEVEDLGLSSVEVVFGLSSEVDDDSELRSSADVDDFGLSSVDEVDLELLSSDFWKSVRSLDALSLRGNTRTDEVLEVLLESSSCPSLRGRIMARAVMVSSSADDVLETRSSIDVALDYIPLVI